MEDRELKRVAIGLGIGVLTLALLNQVYQAGVSSGLARSGDGRYVMHDGPDFFPFPLLLIAGVVGFFWWRRRNGHGRGNGNGRGNGPGGVGPGSGGGRPPRLFEEWHRRAHEAGAGQPQQPVMSAGGQAPASGVQAEAPSEEPRPGPPSGGANVGAGPGATPGSSAGMGTMV